MRILINDYAGHPFQIELSAALARRGHEVLHLFCSTNVTPHGDLDRQQQAGLRVEGVSTGNAFNKYALLRRTWDEVRYGWRSGSRERWFEPDVVLCSNVPVLSLLTLALINKTPRRVLWLQDLQAGLAGLVLGGRRAVIARVFARLERAAINAHDAVVAISPAMRDCAVEAGKDPAEVVVIENWAPIDDLPVLPKRNRWSEEQGLADKLTFLYSGTLGVKHRPSLLVDLAEALAPHRAEVVVISEGRGADRLWQECQARGLENLRVLPFQPFDRVPEVLASADVLLALLEPAAGAFSVPSKVLTYLCAQRPILASLPTENAAAALITERAKSGLVSSADPASFVRAGLSLASNEELRYTMGKSGRAYAENEFDIELIATNFEALLGVTEEEIVKRHDKTEVGIE